MIRKEIIYKHNTHHIQPGVQCRIYQIKPQFLLFHLNLSLQTLRSISLWCSG